MSRRSMRGPDGRTRQVKGELAPMLSHLRARTSATSAMILLALVAFALKILLPTSPMAMPAMPRPALTQAAAMPATTSIAAHVRLSSPARQTDHCHCPAHARPVLKLSCDCAQFLMSTLRPEPSLPLTLPTMPGAITIVLAFADTPLPVAHVPEKVPDRGLAAPPPRSHAPPSLRA